MNSNKRSGLNIGTQVQKVGVAFALTLTLANCTSLGPTGPSQTLAAYTEDQLARCQKSLSFKERDEIVRNAIARNNAKLLIPYLGPLTMNGSEEIYRETEKVCKRKGIL